MTDLSVTLPAESTANNHSVDDLALDLASVLNAELSGEIEVVSDGVRLTLKTRQAGADASLEIVSANDITQRELGLGVGQFATGSAGHGA